MKHPEGQLFFTGESINPQASKFQKLLGSVILLTAGAFPSTLFFIMFI